jgi:hypothetical protein
VLKLSLLGHATYFSTISFCFARLTAGRSNGRDLPSLVPRHTMLHTMPRTIMTGTSTFSGSTTGKLAVHVEVGSGRDLVAKHEHGVGQRLGARDSGSFGRGAEGSNPCFLHRRVLANLTRSIRSPKISPGGLRAAWLRESFALRCTSAGALIWLADDRCPIRPDTPGSGFESCSLQRRLGREPDFRGEEQSRRFAPRHLSVVPGHLRTSKASQASQRFQSAQLLTNRVERWLVLRRFTAVYVRRTQPWVQSCCGYWAYPFPSSSFCCCCGIER